ncbi:MAG: hypothetical protein RQ733_04845 [Methyloprofundus sp.]|nr:hypothetical protein [Methyloprofundus sp.]MDT8425283.1 hypothetical protein [Methyloprofundus sp.]
MRITWKNAWMGGIVYATGDAFATLLTDEFLYQRLVGMLLLGGTLYAWEIPTYFHYLDRCIQGKSLLSSLKRMLCSALFFNPLWIARHLIFIECFAGKWQTIDIDILLIAIHSFVYALPVALLVNYMIQNKTPLGWRYVASSVFSAFMAVYFALSEVLFG